MSKHGNRVAISRAYKSVKIVERKSFIDHVYMGFAVSMKNTKIISENPVSFVVMVSNFVNVS